MEVHQLPCSLFFVDFFYQYISPTPSDLCVAGFLSQILHHIFSFIEIPAASSESFSPSLTPAPGTLPFSSPHPSGSYPGNTEVRSAGAPLALTFSAFLPGKSYPEASGGCPLSPEAGPPAAGLVPSPWYTVL